MLVFLFTSSAGDPPEAFVRKIGCDRTEAPFDRREEESRDEISGAYSFRKRKSLLGAFSRAFTRQKHWTQPDVVALATKICQASPSLSHSLGPAGLDEFRGSRFYFQMSPFAFAFLASFVFKRDCSRCVSKHIN